MKTSMIVGTLLLAAATWLLFAGLHLGQFAGKSLREWAAQGAAWYLLGGAVCAAAGLYLVLGNMLPRRRRFPGQRF